MKKSVARLTDTFEQTAESMSAAFSRADTGKAQAEVKSLRRQFDNANVAIERHKSKISSLQENYNAIMSGGIKLDSVARLEKQLAEVDKEYAKINQRRREIDSEGQRLECQIPKLISPDAVEAVKANVQNLKAELNRIEKAGGALTTKGEALQAAIEQILSNPALTDEAVELTERIAVENAQIDALTNKVNDLSEGFKKTGNEAEDAFDKASEGTRKTEKHTGRAGNAMKQFAVRLRNIVAGAFVFNVISSGLTQLRGQLASMLKTNSAITSSLADIKGNLLTAFQPIYEAVLPALQALMNVLSRVTAYLASFTNMLFGKSVSASAAAAKAIQEQADATGSAAEAANEALGSYDQLNVINQDTEISRPSSAEEITPDFDVKEQSSGLLTNIAEAIKGGDPVEIARAIGDLIRRGVDWLLDNVDQFLENTDWGSVGESIGTFILDTIEDIPEIAMKVGKVVLNLAKASLKVSFGVGVSINKWLEEKIGKQLSDGWSAQEYIDYIFADLKNGDWKIYLEELPDALADIGSSIIQLFWKRIWKAFKLEGFYSDDWEQALEQFGWYWIASWKKFFTETLPEFFTEKIPEFWNGLWSGISSFFGNVGNFFVNAWESIKKGFCDFFGIHSPSTLFEGFGKNMMQGLINGITRMISAVTGTFSTIWSKIKNVFSNVGAWFGEKFKGGFSAVKNAFSTAGTAFKGVWGNIKNAFSNVGSWFGEKFRGGFTSVKGAFSTAGAAFKGIWGNIKGAFGNVSGWFKTTFSLAWEKVKNVFSSGGRVFTGIKDGILNGLKKVINALISGINKVIKVPFDGINTALQKIRDISIFGNHPFSAISTINVPEIPRLATGAVIPPNREFMAVLGDQRSGNNIEAPEALIRKIVREEGSGVQTVNIVATMDGEVVFRKTVELDKKHQKQYGKSAYAT